MFPTEDGGAAPPQWWGPHWCMSFRREWGLESWGGLGKPERVLRILVCKLRENCKKTSSSETLGCMSLPPSGPPPCVLNVSRTFCHLWGLSWAAGHEHLPLRGHRSVPPLVTGGAATLEMSRQVFQLECLMRLRRPLRLKHLTWGRNLEGQALGP